MNFFTHSFTSSMVLLLFQLPAIRRCFIVVLLYFMNSPILNELNVDQQKAAAQTDGPVLILAGAGSGKTRVLTYRVAYLIAEKHVSPHNVLMLTFTNKAAGEMKDRIRKLLTAIAGSTTYDLPYAGTFHSLCVRILRKDGQNIGIAPDFVIYDDQ